MKLTTWPIAFRWEKGILLAGILLAAAWLPSCATVNGTAAGAPRGVAENVTAGVREGEAPRVDTEVKPDAPRRTKAAEERPGLATGIGETVDEPWNRQSFVRAASKPSGMGLVYYNDREGIDAMTGSKRRMGGLEMASGEMVEWGLKSGFGYLPTYKVYEGDSRRFVVGERDSNYSIVLKNRCKSRLEILLSVDGLDVIDGDKAAFSKRGYVVAPGETLEVKGWRTSPSTVARFKFSTVAGSHANLKHGDHRNAGVIGLAIFTEQGVDPWTWMPREVNSRLNAGAFATAP